MNKFNRIVCTVTAAWLVACGVESKESEPSVSSQEIGLATDYAVINLTRSDRDELGVGERFGRLVDAVYGGDSANDIRTSHNVVDVAGKVTRERVEGEVGSLPSIFTVYESADDSFEVFDSTSNPMQPNENDINTAGATAVFAKTYNDLVSSGLVAKSRVKASDVVVREVRAAEGDQSGLRRSWVDEYAFFVPLKIGGVEVGTYERQYGVWVNVHRTGKVRRVQVIGASLVGAESGAVKEVRRVKQVSRKVTAAAAAASQVGRAQINNIGLRYIVDEDAESQELIPRQLVRVVPEGVGAGGEVVHSKALVASHAVNDGSDRVQIWPELGKLGPVPGDKRPE